MYSWVCARVSSRVSGRSRRWHGAVVLAARSRYHTDHGVFGYRPHQDKEDEFPVELLQQRYRQCSVYQLVQAYRQHGHRLATIDPVDFKSTKKKVAELNPERYGLSAGGSLDTRGVLHGTDAGQTDSLQSLVARLQDIYCGPISYEFLHLESEAEREWFARRVEGGTDTLDGAERVKLARELLRSQAWDSFLASKFPAVKRYGAEGAETIVNFMSTLIELAVSDGLQHMVVGMPHRGRLNVLTCLLRVPPVTVFSKYAGRPEFPPHAKVMGDIAQHFGASTDFELDGKTMHFSMLNNPSHLEVVNPVSMGKTRSKQLEIKEGDYSPDGSSRMGDKVMNVQIHGDAAFTGQGINQECLMLSQAPHYGVGGSVHMVTNNQLGFTTPAERGRSSRYATDLAKVISAPVVHVNADYPELVVKATRIAFEYQRRFRKDVFLDYNCFRRWGHNELDDPTFTNPALYRLIHGRQYSIPDLYVEKLKSEGLLKEDDVKSIVAEFTGYLQSQLELVPTYQPEETYLKRQWSGVTPAPSAVEIWDTGVGADVLRTVGEQSVRVPDGFTIHPHLLKTHVKNRLKRVREGRGLDWATAEALAFGSLLLEGRGVRLSGEDVGRGTFSHRHAMLVDHRTNEIHVPLNGIRPDQPAFLEVANSILSEEAVLGYEYGLAADHPGRLVLWEAQFGDFFNGAQMVIDTYISCAESKWMTSCGLVMLLPHGYDGAACDHSSCRLERFLQATDSREAAVDGEDVNMHVVNPTTPAQYFHLLRRQLVRNFRKPLVVVAPKILLRLSEAASQLTEFMPGTYFRPVIGDPIADPKRVKRVIFTSGKHYYALNEERVHGAVQDVAIVRLESLCPFPLHHINEELAKYKNARTFVWSQEEHRNMGAWSFIKPRFENLAATKLQYSGRAEGAACAVGVSSWHKAEAQHVVHEPLYTIR